MTAENLQKNSRRHIFSQFTGSAVMTVFIWLFAWASLFQLFYELPPIKQNLDISSGVQYLALLMQHKPAAFTMAALAVWLIFLPRSYGLFVALCAMQAVNAFLAFPHASNHMFIVFVFSGMAALTFAGGYFVYTVKDGHIDWRRYYADFAPIGRWLLVIMYFYGVFQKINTDFLNPDVSCAVSLWRQTPFFPAFVRDGIFFQYGAIYGTFILETICIFLLLGPPRTRYLGIILGILFHGFIGVNNYLFYAPFSLLCFSLHGLFLQQRNAARMIAYGRILRRRLPVGALAVLFTVIVVLCVNEGLDDRHALQKTIFLLLSLGFIAVLLKVRKPVTDRAHAGYGYHLLRTPTLLGKVVVLLFFLNGLSPYVGFKTGQSIAMFSNLRTEKGSTNHLIMPDIWLELLPYQKETVEIISASPGYLGLAAERHMPVTLYALRAQLAAHPDTEVAFRREGNTHIVHLPADKDDPILKDLPSPLAAKFMVFRMVHTERPAKCED